ncbi:MAG: EAL domain-containing protein, partial [Gammaproteobacteria bacterium]|nr:EAL domain-containing protein [Gammaproteobacteria bacterium]
MYAARLLILDDDPQVGKMIRLIAETVGVAARCPEHADEFFELIDDWRPTHIALDLVMPEMDGVEVLVELARRRCTAKIIITSGVGTRVLDAAGRSANEHGLSIAGVLSKPFSPSTLRALLVEEAPALNGGAGSPFAGPKSTASSLHALSGEDLRRGLEAREFALALQPQVHCTNGELAGFEALARWNHPQLGLVGPDRFIA